MYKYIGINNYLMNYRSSLSAEWQNILADIKKNQVFFIVKYKIIVKNFDKNEEK